jgi:rfaE bifunctional protein nucleotidyltransferase chain/domain
MQEIIQSKIFDAEKLKKQIAAWRLKGDTIVFTNGCFDILHLGHASYLASAKALGKRLIIGVNADSSVKQLKGQNRPINNEEARTFLLASLHVVDAVVVFSQETPESLIELLQPDVVVKGGDYKPEQVVGKKTVEARGGKVVIIPFLEGFSTTNTISRINFEK